MWPAHDDFALLALLGLKQCQGIDHAGIGIEKRHAQALLLAGIRRVAVRRRGGFRQAIAFGKTLTIFIKQTLRHGLRHGCAATAYIHQAA